MNDLLNGVTALTLKEYTQAAEKYGVRHNSSHEAYSVILEELEEAEDIMTAVKRDLRECWQLIKSDSIDTIWELDYFGGIRNNAERVAAEMIQVAAMCHKATKGFGENDR